MSVSLALAIYFITWWIVLFAILPLRFGREEHSDQPDRFAEASGAPSTPRLGLKFLITTIVAAVVFAAIYAVIAYKLIALDELTMARVPAQAGFVAAAF